MLTTKRTLPRSSLALCALLAGCAATPQATPSGTLTRDCEDEAVILASSLNREDLTAQLKLECLARRMGLGRAR